MKKHCKTLISLIAAGIAGLVMLFFLIYRIPPEEQFEMRIFDCKPLPISPLTDLPFIEQYICAISLSKKQEDPAHKVTLNIAYLNKDGEVLETKWVNFHYFKGDTISYNFVMMKTETFKKFKSVTHCFMRVENENIE